MIQLPKHYQTNRSERLGPILELYIRGKTHREIAELLGLKKEIVESTLKSFRSDYLPTIASKGLIPQGNLEETVRDKVNSEFYDKLSKIDSALTNEEMLYCNLYVSTGNSLKALIDSGLDVGLDKGTKEVYDQNCLLRSEMLKRKSNIQEEIRRQQKERMDQLQLDKDRVLQLHMTQLEMLMDEGNPKNRSHIVKLLDQVAKITGSYTHNIQTSELSADDVIDGMLANMQKPLPPELQEFENIEY